MQGTTPSYASTADYLVDRRRLRRRLLFWRAAAFVLLLLIVGGAALVFNGRSPSNLLMPHIARVKIDGVITGDAQTLKLLKRVADSPAAAVLVEINSPGGTTTGAEELFDAMRTIAEKKPVVAVIGTMAASGGYIAALGTDHIVSHGNSLVGSIGVLFEYPNVGALLDRIGVKVEEVKSSPLKAAPNGFEPTSDAARGALASLVADSFGWFRGLVKQRRSMSDAELAKVDDGRVFTGRQAVPLKLVDQIGGEKEAIAWLVNVRGVQKNLSVQDWRSSEGFAGLGLFSVVSGMSKAIGMRSLAKLIDRAAANMDAGTLDGLVAIWHVGPNS